MPSNDRTTRLPLSAKGQRTREQPITPLVAAAVADPSLISFAAGLVDAPTLPAAETLAACHAVLSDRRRAMAALQYDTTLGLADLRRRVLAHLESLEGRPAAAMGLSADNILISTGSQQALYLIADVLVDPGDIVITSNPSYFVFAGALQSLGADVRTVPMDQHGMDVDAVGGLLAQLERQGLLARVKFIYCTSFFQNPTGLTLAAERRPKLLRTAQEYSRHHRILVVEDAAYRELRYDGPALPSIKSFDPANRHTVLTQTFSKPFSPGLKTGYTAMPPDLLEAVLHQKGCCDFGSTNLAQHILLEAMNSGSYAHHVQVLRAAYRKKRDAMLEALDRHMPAGAASWTHPHGGLYVWMTLAEGIDTGPGGLFEQCVKHGVLYVPGEYCYHADEHGRVPQNRLRLSFGQVEIEKIEPGIARLADVIRSQAIADSPQVARRTPQSAIRGVP